MLLVALKLVLELELVLELVLERGRWGGVRLGHAAFGVGLGYVWLAGMELVRRRHVGFCGLGVSVVLVWDGVSVGLGGDATRLRWSE